MSRPGEPKKAGKELKVGLPGEVAAEWTSLLPDDGPPIERFDRAMARDLPDAARRWVTGAIAPGTPMWGSAVLTMQGTIRLGRWRRFAAQQIIRPGHGFVWAGATRFFGIPVTGFDRYSSGTGQMRWRVLATVAVVDSTGPDITRSTAGRLAAESVLVPTAFRDATWRPAGPDRALMSWHVDNPAGGYEDAVEISVDDDGLPREVTMRRWGNPDGQPFAFHPFGAGLDSPRVFSGVTIPSRIRAGWWWGTTAWQQGEFVRARITDIAFR